MKVHSLFVESTRSRYLLPVVFIIAVAVGWLISILGVLGLVLLLGVTLTVVFVTFVFLNPRLGVVTYLVYCFFIMTIGRHVPGSQPGLAIDGLLLLTWLAVIFNRSEQLKWSRIQNTLCVLTLVWFVINLVEIVNPAGANLMGWLYEMRSTTLYWCLTVPLCYLIFYRQKDLQLFLVLIILFSALGAVYGIKQKVFGVDSLEQRWLDAGASTTHILFGRLRVFSFYIEAAQFGASQAHVGVMCLILALGPFKWWKRGLLLLASILILYGMLISGTRGAMFVLLTGVLLYLILSKQVKITILGFILASIALFGLKYTSIGSGNADIVRLRTSLNPHDPSFQLRLMNQAKLGTYLASRPFGGGVGSIGTWGRQYNNENYLSTIPPDSYFIKIWAEYGIVGFIIWFGLMLFILGHCCGIVWRIQNPQLRQKLLALTAGFAGILVSSYGNEVMNQMPSAMILYISWVFVFRGPSLDTNPAALPV